MTNFFAAFSVFLATSSDRDVPTRGACLSLVHRGMSSITRQFPDFHTFSFSWHSDGIWINFHFHFQLPCASTDHPRWETAQCRGCIRKQVRKRKAKIEEQEYYNWKERENLKLEFSFWFWKLCLHLSSHTGHSLLSSWRLMVAWWVFFYIFTIDNW